MSFLFNTLIRSFLAQQAIEIVQREVITQVERELRTRQESAVQAASIRDGQSGVIDFAIIFSRRQEAIGLLDRFPDAALTRGNGNSFYAFATEGKHVVAVVPDHDEHGQLELATNAAIDIFRPRRVVTAGFAAGIAPGVALLSLYVPNVLVDHAKDRTIDLRQMQLAAPQAATTDEIHNRPNSEKTHSETTNEESRTPFRVGTIVTMRRPVYAVMQKQELRKNFAAQLADQSAFPILNVCRNRFVPVLPMRIVTSLYDEELPRDVKTHASGTHPARRFGAFIGNFARRPGSVVDTIKRKQRDLEASDVLAKYIVQLLLRGDNPNPNMLDGGFANRV